MSPVPSFLQFLLRSIHYNCSPSIGKILTRVRGSNRHAALPFAHEQDSCMPLVDRRWPGQEKQRDVRSLASKGTKSNKKPQPDFHAKGTYLDRKQVTKRVLALVAAVPKVDPAKVTLKARFSRDLGLDSLDTVELLMAFEEEFGLYIPNRQADKFVCSADAIDFIACHPRSIASTPKPEI